MRFFVDFVISKMSKEYLYNLRAIANLAPFLVSAEFVFLYVNFEYLNSNSDSYLTAQLVGLAVSMPMLGIVALLDRLGSIDHEAKWPTLIAIGLGGGGAFFWLIIMFWHMSTLAGIFFTLTLLGSLVLLFKTPLKDRDLTDR